jgi:predicted protein tyrosine phosphatase
MHRAKLLTNHRRLLKDKRIVVLGIRDEYALMEPRLVSLLWMKMRAWLPSQ